MHRYISYKRISKIIGLHEIDGFLKDLISDGYEIIYYNEEIANNTTMLCKITTIVGKVKIDV